MLEPEENRNFAKHIGQVAMFFRSALGLSDKISTIIKKITMKKIFTLFVFAIFACVQALASASPALNTPPELPPLYVLGIDNNWNPAQPSLTVTATESGLYVFDYTVSGTTWFALGTQLGADKDDWATFNNGRLGAPAPDFQLEDNSKADLVMGADASFRIEKGHWTFWVDITEMKISAVCKAAYPMTPLYVLGLDNNWNPAQPTLTLLPVDAGIYELRYTLDREAWFALGTVLGEDENDWTTFNTNRLGAPEPDFTLKDGMSASLTPGQDASFHVEGGTWFFVIDLNTMTISAKEEAPMLYIVGLDGNWDVSSPLQVAPGADGTYTFSYNVEADEAWFSLSTVIGKTSDDWTSWNSGRLGAPEPDYTLWKNSSVTLAPGADTSFHIVKGNWTFCVNTSTMTLDVLDGAQSSNGIAGIESAEAASAIYNLAGQRVAKMQHGVYVKNGKKHVK